MGNGRKTTDNRLPSKDNGQQTTDNGQRSKDAVNGPVDCLFLWVFISYYVGWRRSTLRLYRLFHLFCISLPYHHLMIAIGGIGGIIRQTFQFVGIEVY